MGKQNRITTAALWVNRFVAALIVGLAFALPSVIDWYSGVRVLTQVEQTAITAAFYCCVIPIGMALWNLDQLLGSIMHEQVFIRENVRRIRTIQWCCALVSLICIPASAAYLPLIFLVVIMAFLSLVVCVLTRVMATAVALQEENDLTI